VSEAIGPRAGLGIGAVAALATAGVAYAWWHRTKPTVITVHRSDIALAEANEAA
jgi:hypothetical protein